MKRILLAEDDKSLSRSIDILLTLDGYQVISVYHGEEALNKLLQQRFDLLITDIVMPQLNGVDLVEKIRRINPIIPIMIVSGNITPEFETRLSELGIKYILHKPLNPGKFRSMVKSALESAATV